MATCNPGWTYGCHDVKGYNGKVQNVCGCIEPKKVTSQPKKITEPVIRNNKPVGPPLQSRFEGINPQTFNKPGAGIGSPLCIGTAIANNPVVKAISNNPTVSKIQNQFNLPEWAIPAGIMGVTVLIVLLILIR